jgi:hypothetical protein
VTTRGPAAAPTQEASASILDIDYDDGEGQGEFRYDVAAQGPLAAATFSF